MNTHCSAWRCKLCGYSRTEYSRWLFDNIRDHLKTHHS